MTDYLLKIIYLILISFFGISCRDLKENDKAAITNNIELIKEKQIIRVDYGADPEAIKTFEYNTDGDLLKQSLSNGDTVIYNYTENTITKVFKDNANVWISKIEYILNEKGKIINSKTIDDNNKVVSKSTFEYNNGDYLIKTYQTVVETGEIFTNELIYENGNLKEIVIVNPKKKILSTYHFNYHDDKANVFNLFLDGIYDDIFPNERLGKKNKNRVKEMANISLEGDTLSLLHYQYEDTKNENFLSYKLRDVLNDNETIVTYYFNQNKK